MPDLGVPKTTICRYFQSWKHHAREVQFRLLKRLLTSETASREKVARMLGVSEEALMEALKGFRSVAQLEKRLRLEDTKQLEHLAEQAGRLDLKRLIKELRSCQSLEEREAKFREAASRMGVSEGEPLQSVSLIDSGPFMLLCDDIPSFCLTTLDSERACPMT